MCYNFKLYRAFKCYQSKHGDDHFTYHNKVVGSLFSNTSKVLLRGEIAVYIRERCSRQ